jgi:hypothetical protein
MHEPPLPVNQPVKNSFKHANIKNSEIGRRKEKKEGKNWLREELFRKNRSDESSEWESFSLEKWENLGKGEEVGEERRKIRST